LLTIPCLHGSLLTAPLLLTDIASTLIRTLSYHLNTIKSTASVSILAPLYFRRRIAWPV